MEPISVLIADDQALMREGVKTIVELQKDMRVVGTAPNGQIAYEMAKILRPQVILMDIKMPELNGIESTKLIKKELPDTFVIMLSTFDDEEFIEDALYAGAGNYLLKDMPGENIVQAIRRGAEGKSGIENFGIFKGKWNFFGFVDSKKKERVKSFSEREEEIIHYMVQGCTNKKISSILYMAEGTVKNYVSTIYSKIGINDRTKAVLYFKDLGIGNAV